MYDDLDQLLAALADQDGTPAVSTAHAPTEPIVRFAPPRQVEQTVIVDPELLREAEQLRASLPQPLHLARGTTPPPFQTEAADAEVSDSEILAVRSAGEDSDEMAALVEMDTDPVRKSDPEHDTDSEIVALRRELEHNDGQ